MSLLNETYTKNKKEGLSFQVLCHEYQLENQTADLQAKVTMALTAMGVPVPSSYLPGCDPDNVGSVRTTSVLEWSYAPESMWRGPNTPFDHNVLKLAKAMVATGFRQD